MGFQNTFYTKCINIIIDSTGPSIIFRSILYEGHLGSSKHDLLSQSPIYKPYHVRYHFKELSFFYVMAEISLEYYNVDTTNIIVNTCLYTGKRQIPVENITFYLLISVQNINHSS